VSDAVRKRFSATAALIGERQERRLTATRERIVELVAPKGTERALDVGSGAGALAIALCPLVASVVGVDLVPELLAEARRRAPAEVEFVEADATALPFADGSFDLVCTARTLHHVARPDVVAAEMRRVLRAGGTMLVADQVAPEDLELAVRLNRFERARDPSTTRVLADAELRGLLTAEGLVLDRVVLEREERELEAYLDLAACHGPARERARALAPADLSARIGWYLVTKPALDAAVRRGA
jgi:ubiquinone/menaquinone biosynthesis C-methylase UbiE